MRTTETCPICGSRGSLVSVGAFGYVAHCGDCYEPEDEAPDWRRVRGHGQTEHEAVELWLEAARDVAANDEIPALTCSYQPNPMWKDLQAQVSAEFERQTDYDLVPAWRWVPDEAAQDGRRAQDILFVEFPQ